MSTERKTGFVPETVIGNNELERRRADRVRERAVEGLKKEFDSACKLVDSTMIALENLLQTNDGRYSYDDLKVTFEGSIDAVQEQMDILRQGLPIKEVGRRERYETRALRKLQEKLRKLHEDLTALDNAREAVRRAEINVWQLKQQLFTAMGEEGFRRFMIDTHNLTEMEAEGQVRDIMEAETRWKADQDAFLEEEANRRYMQESSAEYHAETDNDDFEDD